MVKIKEFINPTQIWLPTKEGKGTTLDKILKKMNNKIDGIKLISLLDNKFTAQSNQFTYKKLNDNYTNYDVLFVRVASSSGGGEGVWVPMLPKIQTQTNWYHYVISTYFCSGQIEVRNSNEIGFMVKELRGWLVDGIIIHSVYGLKFN